MRLSLRTQKLTLSAITGISLLVAIAVVGWGLQAPSWSAVESRSGDAQSSMRDAESSQVQPQEPAREEFAQLCERPLRRPLYDPPPPKPEVRQLPPLGVELLGTILEGDNSIAIVRSEQGQVAYRRKGDSVGPVDSPARVVEIQSDAVLLDRAEERVTLKVLSSEQR